MIHYSDRGIQYCSSNYINILNKYSIAASMSEPASPTQIAIAVKVKRNTENRMDIYDGIQNT